MYVSRKKETSPEQALVRLEELCVKAERCEDELRRKLTLWRIAPADADAIIDSLRARRFLDERRFAAAFVRDRYRFGKWGRRKIVQALRLKRIPGSIIEEGLAQIDADEYLAILAALLRFKAKDMEHPLSFEDKNRLFRFAVGRGFEPDLVANALKSTERP